MNNRRNNYRYTPVCETQIPSSSGVDNTFQEDFYSVPKELKKEFKMDKNRSYKVNDKHTWWKGSRIVKSLNSFLTYQLASLASLIWPDIADKVMYETLKEQFEPQQ